MADTFSYKHICLIILPRLITDKFINASNCPLMKIVTLCNVWPGYLISHIKLQKLKCKTKITNSNRYFCGYPQPWDHSIFSVPHLSEFAQGVAFRLHLQVISLLHLSSSCYKVLGNIAKHTPEKNVKMLTHYPKWPHMSCCISDIFIV